jgi:Zn-dependent peptidase ImmA (M78 family)
MIVTEKLECILKKCHIIKEFATLPESILGYYYCDGDYYVILINEKIRSNERLYRCVLAEEIGHYRTTIGDITPRKYMCYKDRLTVDKMELYALRWATDFIIPTDMLLDTIKDQSQPTITQLVNHFQVTQTFMMQKLEFMLKQNCIWDIDSKRSLYLLNYPSIHIYERI